MTHRATFRIYELVEVLSGDELLVLNGEARILTLLGGSHGEVNAQACLSEQAQAVLQALCEAHPAPCPLVTLYAAFADLAPEDARLVLEALQEAGVRDLGVAGLDAALSDCRAQLAAFDLGVQPVPEEDGYRLVRLSLR